jgi:hypothetical protein
MAVLKTTSPVAIPSAPMAIPLKISPFASARTADLLKNYSPTRLESE